MFYTPDLLKQDWTDGYNPELSMSTLKWKNRAVWEALNHPTMKALRNSTGYQLRLQVVPGGASYNVAPRATFQENFGLKPGSFLLGFSGMSQQPEGYDVQVRDLSNNSSLFSQPISYSLITNPPRSTVASPLHYLPKPRVFPTGAVHVDVSNSSSNQNNIAFVMWFLEPINPTTTQQDAKTGKTLHGLGDTPTAWEAALQSDVLGSQLALRSRTGNTSSTDTANTPAPAQWNPGIMPLDGKPFFYLNATDAPQPGTGDFPVIQFRVPAATTAYIKEIQNFYEGPGFINGSGSIIWRISIDGTFAPGFDAINSNVGTNGFHELAGPLIARSGQLVQYLVNVDVNAHLGGQVTCGLQGFFAPEL